MHKYHFNIRLDNVRYNHAGSKAVEDCKAILLKDGFQDIEVSFVKKSYMMPINLLKLFYLLVQYSFIIKPGSLVIVQYPLLGINNYFKHFARLIKAKKCKLVCIIHDLDAIRSENNAPLVKRELDRLNVYDAVIAHNGAMKSWLLQNGYKGQIACIQLFDYLSDFDAATKPSATDYSNVDFAGNLGRPQFIAHLNEVQKLKFNLYGPDFNPEIIKGQGSIEWQGVFTPEQISAELKGAFGLIWDGTSINECTGLMGNYLKFNTPHKTSLYLVSGLPVIVCDTSAIADFIKSNKLGVVVKGLHDLTSILPSITKDEYEVMKSNVLQVSQKLKMGFYLKEAVAQVN